MHWLKGKKTYIVAIAIGIVATLEAAGFLSSDVATQLELLLGGAGLAALRAGVSR